MSQNKGKPGNGVNWDTTLKVLASIAAFATAVVAVYDLIDRFRSDAPTFTSFLIPGALIVIWLSILAQLLRSKNPYVIPWLLISLVGGIVGGIAWRTYSQAQQDEKQMQATQQAQVTQTAQWVRQDRATQRAHATQLGVQTQQAQATQFAVATRTAEQELKEKLVVAIATFDGDEDTYALRHQIFESLDSAFAQETDIQLIALGEKITPDPDRGSSYARARGEELFADLVIWGWYRPTEDPNIHIHIENLSPAEFDMLQESQTYQPQANLAQLQSHEIQRQIGSETSTLISFLIGTLDYKAGNYPAAIDQFERILSHEDISTFVNPFDVFFNLGYCYLHTSSYEDSVQYYNQAIEADQEHAEAYNSRGLAYYLQEKYDLSIQDLDKAIELDPDHAVAYNNRGASYYALGDYQSSVQDFNRSIALDPKYTPAYYNRGITFRRLEDYPASIQDFDQALELNPRYLVAYIGRGLSYADLEDYEQAIRDYERAIELDPEFADTYRYRGRAYEELGMADEAGTDFRTYEALTGQKP